MERKARRLLERAENYERTAAGILRQALISHGKGHKVVATMHGLSALKLQRKAEAFRECADHIMANALGTMIVPLAESIGQHQDAPEAAMA